MTPFAHTLTFAFVKLAVMRCNVAVMPRSSVYRYPNQRPCVHCRTVISDSLRRDRAYCSNRCRQAAYRARKAGRALTYPRASA